MNIVTFPLDEDSRIFCPFCGKQVFDFNSEATDCPHVLFSCTTAAGGQGWIRKDIADPETNQAGDLGCIHPKFRVAKDEDGKPCAASCVSDPYDDEWTDIRDQIEQARIPDSVCFELEGEFCPPLGANGDSVYIGFCRDEAVNAEAIEKAVAREISGPSPEEQARNLIYDIVFWDDFGLQKPLGIERWHLFDEKLMNLREEALSGDNTFEAVRGLLSKMKALHQEFGLEYECPTEAVKTFDQANGDAGE